MLNIDYILYSGKLGGNLFGIFSFGDIGAIRVGKFSFRGLQVNAVYLGASMQYKVTH